MKQISKLFIRISLLLLIWGFSLRLDAQEKSNNQSVALHRTETFNLTSSINGQNYPIKIALPGSYYTSDRTYPVVYMLDAYSSFGIMTEMARLLASDKEIPEIIIVGISSEGGSKEFIYNRSRDYTPVPIPQQNIPDEYKSLVPVSGGAEKFFGFIKNELIPAAESKYRIDSSDRTLEGHSLGGLFVFYSLFQQPDLFKRYISISPALEWDGGFVRKLEKEFFESKKPMTAVIYTAVGSMESDKFTKPWVQFIDNMKTRNYPGLEMKTEMGNNETHYTMIPYIATHGLKSVFAAGK